MKYKKLMLWAFLLIGIGRTVNAQEAIPATGGNASGNGGSASYSIGQVAYTTNTGPSGSIAQGVQQPYEISVITAIGETEDIKLLVSVYPNPTTNVLNVNIEASSTRNTQSMSYQLFDITGKLLESNALDGNKTSIVMSHLVPASYFIKVYRNQKELKTFKIIKK